VRLLLLELPVGVGRGELPGPTALLKAHRFEVDSRDEARKERMPRWSNERGVYRCHTIMNCVEACPKELNPTEGSSRSRRRRSQKAVREGEIAAA